MLLGMMSVKGKQRLDVWLTERGLAESREQAQRLVLAGMVDVEGQTVTKAGQRLGPDAQCTVRRPPPFVSRGGEKLEGAFTAFPLDVAGRVCLDVGASTGGFTDCLLQHGAARVHAVDVGKGLLHWKLRQDPRVSVHEGRNARHLKRGDLDPVPDFAVVDVAFISLTKVLPGIMEVMAPVGQMVSLIKPQFEAGRADVGKGGVVRDPDVHARVVAAVQAFGVQTLGLEWIGVVPSPLRGPAGNVEYLAYWRWPRESP